MSNLQTLKQLLASKMVGHVSSPGEPAYQRAVSIWAKPRVLPSLVAHCESVADVQLAVLSARDASVPLSVCGGGHDWTGRALCSGLTLDMSAMNSVKIVGKGDVVEVGGGTRGTDVYSVTDPAGMAPVLGSVAVVGLAGLITGGGYGPLMRRFGLACDNLRSATVVLPDGNVVRADDDGDAELFWAIRGGGGNFGVVTSMELQLHPLPSVRSGVLVFPLERADAVLPLLRGIWAEAPLELDVQFGIVPGPGGAYVLYVSPTWCGEPEGADPALAPLYAIEGRIMADVRDQPFGASRRFFDEHIVNGLLTTADNVWLREWNSEISALVMDAVRRRPNDQCFVLAHDFSGVAAQVPSDATAFGLRKSHIWFEAIAPVDPASGSDGSAEAAWARAIMNRLMPFTYPGGYPNMLDVDQSDRIQHSFGANAERLIAAKRRYDPEDLFRSTVTLPDPLRMAGSPLSER